MKTNWKIGDTALYEGAECSIDKIDGIMARINLNEDFRVVELKKLRVKPLTFAEKLKKYKTYDTSTGMGNVNQWRQSFESMNGEQARAAIGADDPLSLLGFDKMPTNETELKAKYRPLILQNHPDNGGDPEKAKKIIAAYTLLLEKIQLNCT